MLHGTILRSPLAHARIRSIDVTAARAHPQVEAVLTGEDLTERGLSWMPTLSSRRSPGGRYPPRRDARTPSSPWTMPSVSLALRARRTVSWSASPFEPFGIGAAVGYAPGRGAV